MGSKLKCGAAIIAAGVLLGSFGFNGQLVNADASKMKVNEVAQKSAVAEVTLKWNGRVLPHKAMLDHGAAFVPATAIRDVMGIPLKYDAKSRTYTFGKGYNKLQATVYADNEVGLTVNGYYVGESGGQVVNGRLYIPYQILNEYMGVQGQWNPSQKTLSMTSKKQNPITIESDTLKKQVLNVEAVVNYPVISGFENKEAQTAINNVLRKNAEDMIAEAQEILSEQPAFGYHSPYVYVGDFVIHYNAKDILSLTTYRYTYTGGAHGMTYRKSFTFSLKDGKQLKLDDFINTQGKSKQKLNDYVLNQLQKNEGYLGGFESVPADADFFLKDNAAVLYFQLYEYTAYAFGFPQIELSLKQWK
ncbi:PdaC/SigV domain-containing protein [Paenibacillus faecalis]|uniref:PdaC/SigV domain-containing protein n=1 Tax=Paenibacillus faecalis TaxID=2079532 RepID=UPI000D0E7CA3|nr:DUF4163 domain-containing protein [Paenibacillus faecalis]